LLFDFHSLERFFFCILGKWVKRFFCIHNFTSTFWFVLNSWNTMSATPFADQRTTAGDTFMGRSRIIYNFGFCKPLKTLWQFCSSNEFSSVRIVPKR
jgi:hypothetical protein